MVKQLPFSAVLWDMDGVIVDTYEGHLHAWQYTFNQLGHPITQADFTRTFGMNNRLILHTLLGYDLSEDEVQLVSDSKEAYFRENIRGHAHLLPGVANLLNQFSVLGLKQAVASSAPQENVDALLDELGIRGCFQAEVAGALMQGKPDPAIFLLAAEKLAVEPHTCLVLEDAIAGVEAARRAGMKCVAVLTTNTAEELASADVIVKDLSYLDFTLLQRVYSSKTTAL